jgi:uncharacterized protein YbbK (DUF523 family)
VEGPTLVSACLLGFPCRHDGTAKTDPAVLAALEGKDVVPICPEAAAGLGIPRPPCAFQGDDVVDVATGASRTDAFHRGANVALAAMQRWESREAVLKERSPSCGRDWVYRTQPEGSPRRARGQGITAQALTARGCRVWTEEDIPNE